MSAVPDRLLSELTAHRTLALRYALGEHADIAFTAALHALRLKVFYRYGQDSCLELDLKSASFGAQAPGLADTPLATSFDARHQAWIASFPKERTELWDALAAFDIYRQRALFAHCVSLSVTATFPCSLPIQRSLRRRGRDCVLRCSPAPDPPLPMTRIKALFRSRPQLRARGRRASRPT